MARLKVSRAKVEGSTRFPLEVTNITSGSGLLLSASHKTFAKSEREHYSFLEIFGALIAPPT